MATAGIDTRGGVSRRGFLGRCGGCALAAACVGIKPLSGALAGPPPRRAAKPRIRLVFSHIPPGAATWPYATYDYETRKAQITQQLTAACPELDWLPPVTIQNAEEAKKLLADDPAVDGYVVAMVGIWTHGPAVIGASGKPTLFVDDAYGGSGEFLIANASARRLGHNVAGVSSTRFDDVVTGARCLAAVGEPAAAAAFAATCGAALRATYAAPGDVSLTGIDVPPRYDLAGALERMKQTSILLVGQPMHAIEASITETFGTKVVAIDFPELEASYTAACPQDARSTADRWMAGAARVGEPTAEEIVKSAAMYIGMRALLERYQASAIAINCLGGFYGGHMSAYPCLGFTQLNDDGLVGACEADMRSTITMLAMSELVGRPGFISDPVIDTSRNQIIYAHCVAPTKVDGPGGATNPYEIRSHSEDRHGASLRSLLPLGRMTTTIELDPLRKQIVFHQGKSVSNVDEDKACRTKLAVEVKGDIDRLLGEWDQWGWHRVTYYGDLTEPVRALADRLGYTVVNEA
jgi:hypothetical protein